MLEIIGYDESDPDPAVRRFVRTLKNCAALWDNPQIDLEQKGVFAYGSARRAGDGEFLTAFLAFRKPAIPVPRWLEF